MRGFNYHSDRIFKKVRVRVTLALGRTLDIYKYDIINNQLFDMRDDIHRLVRVSLKNRIYNWVYYKKDQK